MKKHALNIRYTVPFLFGKFYFVFLFGKDERNNQSQQITVEKRAHNPWLQVLLFNFLLIWAFLGFIGLTVVTLYLAKSYMGIDLVEGRSPFVEFLHWIRLCHNI